MEDMKGQLETLKDMPILSDFKCLEAQFFQNRKNESEISFNQKQTNLGNQQQLQIADFDYMEILCSNAKQAAHYYHTVFGFQPFAYRGLGADQSTFSLSDRSVLKNSHTQHPDMHAISTSYGSDSPTVITGMPWSLTAEYYRRELTCSYVLKQGSSFLVLTSSVISEGFIADHVKNHGDGVYDIGFRTNDACKAFYIAVERGATPISKPLTYNGSNGNFSAASVHAYGDTIHTFVNRCNYFGYFMPGFQPWNRDLIIKDVGLVKIDHVVANVDCGQMNELQNYYERVMGLKEMMVFSEEDIRTEYTALKSVVMTNENKCINIPINEPAAGLKKSQIAEFIDFYNGPGYQHVAFQTEDIIRTVKEMKQSGCEFLTIADEYYRSLRNRNFIKLDKSIDILQENGILADEDRDGYILQIFTRPVGDRPTLFFEIIQRKGSKGFGRNNFNALFKAIEEEQRRRGTF